MLGCDEVDEISIIVPCYNEEQALPFFYKEICEVSNIMHEQKFEFIFVNDGSQDNTLDVIKNFWENDKRIRYISFSRNFGKEAAMYAGLEESEGKFIVIMDADMQDPPSLLPQMYDYVKDGKYDSVATRRVTRKGEPPIRSFFAKRFYKVINKISDADIVDGARDFRLMSRQMVDAILSMKEYNRFSKGIYGWVGFKTKWLNFKNVERIAGETKWSFWKLFLYSLEGIIGFSTRPLALASIFGIFFCIISFTFTIYIIIKSVIFKNPVEGWPSLACLILFIGGIQLFCIGIIGQYLSKTYLETKGRPIYIIKETEKLNNSNKNKIEEYIKLM